MVSPAKLRARFGLAYRDRFGHLSSGWDGDVETEGWDLWRTPCPACEVLLHEGLYGFAWSTPSHRRHRTKIILTHPRMLRLLPPPE